MQMCCRICLAHAFPRRQMLTTPAQAGVVVCVPALLPERAPPQLHACEINAERTDAKRDAGTSINHSKNLSRLHSR